MIPQVSVIIATYNEAAYIDACLASLMRQTHPSFEVLVIDDGSTDATVQRAIYYPVKLIKTPHNGPALARNFGASCSDSEILVFLDADMAFAPDFLTRLVAPIAAGKAVGTFSREEYVGNPCSRWASWWNLNNGLPHHKRHALDYPQEDTSFRAILRKEFLRVGGYDNIGYGEDQSVSRKLGIKALAAPGAVFYHFNPASMAEVFSSACWYGRGEQIRHTLATWLRHTPLFSIKEGLRKGLPVNSPGFLLFKLVFDFGVLCGISGRALSPRRHWK